MVLECPQLQELQGVEYVMSLEMLSVDGCPKVQWGQWSTRAAWPAIEGRLTCSRKKIVASIALVFA